MLVIEPTEKTASKSDSAIKRSNGEGSIYEIGRGSDGRPNKWRAAIHDINGKRRTKGKVQLR